MAATYRGSGTPDEFRSPDSGGGESPGRPARGLMSPNNRDAGHSSREFVAQDGALQDHPLGIVETIEQMKLTKLAFAAAVACGITAGNLTAGEANDISLVSHCSSPLCDSDPSCGCETDGCDGGCDSLCGLGGDCCLGEPFSLFGEHCGWTAGGWLQMGYHTNSNGLFNNRPDELQLQQAWLYAEKGIDTRCGFDIGGRVDVLYGTDAQNTQAFGTDPTGWDNDWDNGGPNGYGFAMPQAYVEAGYGDFSVKAGHFYTIIGYEVVTAPDNFFYSHAYTFNNSEPFTHTGLLGTYNMSDDVTLYGGYTMGWDSGFDDNGDTFIGGISADVSCDLTLTYATNIGRFNEARFNGAEQGYMHSFVADYSVTDRLNYVFQSDLLDTEDEAGANVRDTFGINQYLTYQHSDCVGIGGRFEWWNAQNGAAINDADVYALTLGVNYRPHANVIVRPEVRWDWDDSQIANLDDVGRTDMTTFGIDTILTF